MKVETGKKYLVGISLAAVTFFFWLFLYQIFVTSQASNTKVHVLFERSHLTIKDLHTPVQVNVLMQSGANNPISHATYVVKYDPALLTFVRTLGNRTNAISETEQACVHNNYVLNRIVSITHDPNRGLVTINRTSPDQNYPSGMFCLGTLTFQPKTVPSADTVALSFGQSPAWDIGGPEGNYDYGVLNYNSTVTVNP